MPVPYIYGPGKIITLLFDKHEENPSVGVTIFITNADIAAPLQGVTDG